MGLEIGEGGRKKEDNNGHGERTQGRKGEIRGTMNKDLE